MNPSSDNVVEVVIELLEDIDLGTTAFDIIKFHLRAADNALHEVEALRMEVADLKNELKQKEEDIEQMGYDSIIQQELNQMDDQNGY